MHRWGDLFNARQQLALVTFADLVRRAHAQMLAQGADPEFAKAVATYLALVVSRMTDFETTLCRWHPQWEFIPNTFAASSTADGSGIIQNWFPLVSPILTGTWSSMFGQISEVLETLAFQCRAFR
jgi:putative DNA methylase